MRIQITDIDTNPQGFPVDLVQATDMDGGGFVTLPAADFAELSTGELASILRTDGASDAREGGV